MKSSPFRPESPTSRPEASHTPHLASQLGSLIFDRQPSRNRQQNSSSDTVWRGLYRRERLIEQEIQQLLDLQATGLIAGSGAAEDNVSDTGSSTPTGTFYSTTSTQSRMMNSLHIPTRSNADGNIIPVRQPSKEKPLGLRSARAGLRKAMSSLAELKQEEDTHVDAALLDRKRALIQIKRLSKQKHGVEEELQIFEEDDEEPLGKEMRELSLQFNAVDSEVLELEEKLMALRNHRRSLRERLDDAKNRREAGLSGYKGALKDANRQLAAIMIHPPVQPLDKQLRKKGLIGSSGADSPGGDDFMQLIPERRTAEMAQSWWEGEVAILEERRRQIGKERDALEQGTEIWKDVIALVGTFEANLRNMMKTGAAPHSATEKGKNKMPSQEDIISSQAAEMDVVVSKLQQYLNTAESNEWNLLICAIGAELEAFREAQDLLKSMINSDETADTGSNRPDELSQGVLTDESDNEVPPDLLVSHNVDSQSTGISQQSAERHPLTRQDSANDVPPEFLAEHGVD